MCSVIPTFNVFAGIWRVKKGMELLFKDLETPNLSLFRVGCRDQLGYQRSRLDSLGVSWERLDDGAASRGRSARVLPCNSQAVGEPVLAANSSTARRAA